LASQTTSAATCASRRIPPPPLVDVEDIVTKLAQAWSDAALASPSRRELTPTAGELHTTEILKPSKRTPLSHLARLVPLLVRGVEKRNRCAVDGRTRLLHRDGEPPPCLLLMWSHTRRVGRVLRVGLAGSAAARYK